ncbi:10899_t:CDS:1, partial [Funneliformis geosporum]
MVRKVTIYTRAAEYSNDFRVDDGLLLCIYCNHSVKWEKKSSIKDHIQGVTHCAKKREYENKQKTNGNVLQQRTIASTILNANSKNELIEDLIHAFAVADIPLE